MERRVLLGTHPNFSIHFLLILGPMSQNLHYNTTNMFAWVGAEQSEEVFLNDFLCSAQIIPWHDFLMLLEGQTVQPAPNTLPTRYSISGRYTDILHKQR